MREIYYIAHLPDGSIEEGWETGLWNPVFRGWTGARMFIPEDGGAPLYLFPSEIVSDEECETGPSVYDRKDY